ncbi:ATP-binding cassette domain-containing protein [Geoglobus acetivorans]|uniref:ABC transporter ATP-binding protein n=1 Tax=Geoglobus acetivorans TaxID=565033 RepID=A0ABZ3H1W7_GEOAI|nr:ABC transporter ATP-binding protein [Geoglobus acetivorans]
MSLISLEDVWKTYRMDRVEVHALRGATLEVGEGEFVVILGPSGSGKTTLLNIIGGIDLPTKGKVYFRGRDISKLDDRELTLHRRKNVGFVFQFFNLLPTLTARENVMIAQELVDNPRDVDEVLEFVGLGDRANHFPSELSGGEQQRVAIARALVKNPPLILADEPTGSLDLETGKRVLRVMRDINRESRITFILVTHNSVIGEMADKIVRLRDGKVADIKINESPLEPEELEW